MEDDKDSATGGGCAFEAEPVIELFNKDGSRNSEAYCAWPRGHVTWALENVPDGLDWDDCRDILRDSFAIWTAQCALAIDEIDAAAGPDILIAFHSDKVFRDLKVGGVKRSAVAYPPCDRPRKRGRIVFNTWYDWRLTSLSQSGQHPNLLCFAVHEAGHALGIKIHGEQADDVMQTDPSHWRGTLSPADVAHITTLYPNGGNGNDLFI